MVCRELGVVVEDLQEMVGTLGERASSWTILRHWVKGVKDAQYRCWQGSRGAGDGGRERDRKSLIELSISVIVKFSWA